MAPCPGPCVRGWEEHTAPPLLCFPSPWGAEERDFWSFGILPIITTCISRLQRQDCDRPGKLPLQRLHRLTRWWEGLHAKLPEAP